MHDCGLKIVYVDFVFGDVVGVVVGLAVLKSGFYSAARHPEGEGGAVVVASVAFGVVDVALAEGGAPEFTAPDDESVFEEAALFEIFDECGGGLVSVPALDFELGGDVLMLVPPGVHELDELSSPFCEAAGEKAVSREGTGALHIGPIHVENVLWFTGKIGELGYAGLHAVGHLVLGNAGLNLGIGDVFVVFAIEGGDVVDHSLFHVATQSLGIRQEEDGVALAAELHALVFAGNEAAAPVVVVKELSTGVLPIA